jgi:3-methyladenine DNA glycosylase AlkD
MKYEEILERLKSLSDPKAIEGMEKFGIIAKNTYGVSIPELRKIAKEVGRDHFLAQKLWSSEVHEARLLACLIDDSRMVSEEQMENWVRAFYSWDVCDQCCSNLFDKTKFAYRKAVEWSSRGEEYVKRAGFVLMATLAVHDKAAEDETFIGFLPIIKRESVDERNYVKKAVNWALRQIGKRNELLRAKAIETAKEMQKTKSKSALWIANDALRELTNRKGRKQNPRARSG